MKGSRALLLGMSPGPGCGPPAVSFSPFLGDNEVTSFKEAAIFPLFLIAAMVLHAWPAPAPAQSGRPPAALRRPPLQQLFHTERVDVVYDRREHLEELARRLGVAPPAPGAPPDLGALALRLDDMLAEITRVLKRQPPPGVRLRLRLVPDALAVRRQHDALTGLRPHTPGPRGWLPAFYEPKSRTLYLSVADARIGLLAHELTHFVLSESPGGRPSEVFQESLARYLEERYLSGRSFDFRPPGP